MTAEWLALLLLLTLAEIKITERMCLLAEHRHRSDDYLRLYQQERQSHLLRRSLSGILNLPCFGRAVSDLPGFTEGRYRSIFPTWALAQCSSTSSQHWTEWWNTLALRVNYGLT